MSREGWFQNWHLNWSLKSNKPPEQKPPKIIFGKNDLMVRRKIISDGRGGLKIQQLSNNGVNWIDVTEWENTNKPIKSKGKFPIGITYNQDGKILQRITEYNDGSTTLEGSNDNGSTWFEIKHQPVMEVKKNYNKHIIFPNIKWESKIVLQPGEKVTVKIPKLDIEWDTDEPPKIHKIIDPDNSKKEKHFICPGDKCPLCDKEHKKDNKKITGTTNIDELF